MNALVTQRLVEMTFAPLDEVVAWLARLGLETDRREAGVVRVYNPHLDITTAVMERSDPVSRAVCLAFALASVYWPHVFPNLLTEVNKEWRLRQAQANATAQGEAEEPAGKNKKRRPARQPPITAPTFAELYKKYEPR